MDELRAAFAAPLGRATAAASLQELTPVRSNCPEPNVMADFYAALLGGTVTRRTAGEAKLDTADRIIYFRVAADYRPPTWPSPEVPLHSHFDYVVEDPHAAAQHLLRLGGSLTACQDPSDPIYWSCSTRPDIRSASCVAARLKVTDREQATSGSAAEEVRHG